MKGWKVEGDKEKERGKKCPRLQKWEENTHPNCNLNVLSSTSGFFLPTRVPSATDLGTTCWSSALQLVLQTGLREDSPTRSTSFRKAAGGGGNVLRLTGRLRPPPGTGRALSTE